MPNKKIRRDHWVDTMLACYPERAKQKKETVDDFAQDLFSCMEQANYNPGTIRNYTAMYIKFFSDTMKCTKIYENLQKYVSMDLSRLYSYGFTYEYRSIARTVFNHIFNYAVALGYITENPCYGMKLKE